MNCLFLGPDKRRVLAGAGGGLASRSRPSLKRAWLAVGCLFGLLVAPGVLGGCKRSATQDNVSASTSAAAVPVSVATVEQRDVPVQVRAIGTVEPYRTVSLKSQVQGELIEVAFKEGQYVNEGDVLFKIDPRPYEAALKLAEATLAKGMAVAKDAEEEAKWLAGLLGSDAAAERESERARAAADSAWAQVDADRATVDDAKLSLAYCTIRAPFEGFTGSLMVHHGAVLKARETDLVVLNQVKPIYVSFSVPESQLGDIRTNVAVGSLEVEAAFPTSAGPPVRGVLSFVDNQADHTTGMIRLKGTFANEDNDQHLWPGQFVNVALTLSTDRGAILVPTQAVQTGQTGQFVFVVKEDQTVMMKQVTSRQEANGWTVVQGELKPGQTVVTDGQLRLVPGSRVEFKAKAPIEAASRPATTSAASLQDEVAEPDNPAEAATQPAAASEPDA